MGFTLQQVANRTVSLFETKGCIIFLNCLSCGKALCFSEYLEFSSNNWKQKIAQQVLLESCF